MFFFCRGFYSDRYSESVLYYVGYIDNPNDDDITKLTKINVLKCACNLDNKKCKKVTALKLSKHVAKFTSNN